MAQLKPATLRDVQRVERAIELLKEARDLFADAGCSRTAQRVRATLRSAGGALRHIDRRRDAWRDSLGATRAERPAGL